MKTPLILLCLLSGVHPVESMIQVTGYVGESAVIRCPYDGGYEGYSKYLCRGECPSAWLSNSKDIPVQTQVGETNAQRGRFSLHDDTAARVFTVTITGLTAQDSGQYWCGIKTGFGKNDVYTEVMLSVSQVPPPSPNWTSPPTTKDFILSPSSPPSPSCAPIFSTSDHTLETTISHSTVGVTPEIQDETEDSGVVLLILCSVGLLVMVVTCGALAYYKLRGKKSKGNVPSSLQNNWSREEPNDYEMSEEQGDVTEAPVSTLYCLAGSNQRPPQHQLHPAVSPVSPDLDQPIYCNSKDTCFTIYSNDGA